MHKRRVVMLGRMAETVQMSGRAYERMNEQ